jgi:hypothetical protein
MFIISQIRHLSTRIVQGYRCLYTNNHVISSDDEEKLFANSQEKIKTQCQLCYEHVILTKTNKGKQSYMIETNMTYYSWRKYSAVESEESKFSRAFSYYVPIKETYQELKNLNVNTKQIKSLGPSFEDIKVLLDRIEPYETSPKP